jgi:hypothetical protein
MSRLRIKRAVRGDLPGVLSLLEENGLPPDGLEDHLATTLVAREGERVVGSAAVELYGPHALLRSVAEGRSGVRLGGRLAGEALGLARERGATAAYLLTATGTSSVSVSLPSSARRCPKGCAAPSSSSPPARRARGRWPSPSAPAPRRARAVG